MAKRVPNGKAWIKQIFKAKAASTGGSLRRKKSSVDTHASEALLLAEVKQRGFHLILIDDQYLILCNSGKIQLITK